MKCDYCENPATSYGGQASYQACDSHLHLGEAVEDKMFEEMEKDEMGRAYIEFLRET